MIEKQRPGKYKRYLSKKPEKTLKNKIKLVSEAIGLWAIFDAFPSSSQPTRVDARRDVVKDCGTYSIWFFLSAADRSFKMLVRKEVTAGNASHIFGSNIVPRQGESRFFVNVGPAREQWSKR